MELLLELKRHDLSLNPTMLYFYFLKKCVKYLVKELPSQKETHFRKMTTFSVEQVNVFYSFLLEHYVEL